MLWGAKGSFPLFTSSSLFLLKGRRSRSSGGGINCCYLRQLSSLSSRSQRSWIRSSGSGGTVRSGGAPNACSLQSPCSFPSSSLGGGGPFFFIGKRSFSLSSAVFHLSSGSSSSREGEGLLELEVADSLSSSSLSHMELLELSAPTSGTIFSDFGPVIYAADLLCALKDISGFAWVPVIVLMTIVIRLGTGLPTAIAQQRAIKRLEDVKPEVAKMAKELNKETALAVLKFGWDEKMAKLMFRKSFKKHWRRLMEEHNCHPMKSLALGLIQIPIWICFSGALRNIVAGLPLPRTEEQAGQWYEMYTDTTLPWIDNLTVPDPIVLPVIFLGANLVNIYLNSRNRPQPPEGMQMSKLQRSLPWIFTGGVTVLAGFACIVPSAVSLYWTTSSTVALAQNIALMHPELRRKLKMPVYSSTHTQSQPLHPSK